MMFAIKVDADGRILSATYAEYAAAGDILVNALPDGDITDYRYADGEFIYDPHEHPEETPSALEQLEAQALYTAIMTGTLL